jgi:hypothetical protein
MRLLDGIALAFPLSSKEATMAMGGPWKARGFDSRAWRRPTALAGRVGTSVTHEAAIALTWLATVLAGAAVLMLLANGW